MGQDRRRIRGIGPQPFCIVKHIGFRRLMDKAEPRYTAHRSKKIIGDGDPGNVLCSEIEN